MSSTLSKTKQEKALQIVAKWLGPRMGCMKPCGKCGPCTSGIEDVLQCDRPVPAPAPTGFDAALHGEGPMLEPAWDWPSSGPTPTILLEGGPYDWAVEVSLDVEVVQKMYRIGVFAEPYAGYALCLYPA